MTRAWCFRREHAPPDVSEVVIHFERPDSWRVSWPSGHERETLDRAEWEVHPTKAGALRALAAVHRDRAQGAAADLKRHIDRAKRLDEAAASCEGKET